MHWEDEVQRLYLRDEDMEVDELERLLAVAVRGERPDDPRIAPLRPPPDQLTTGSSYFHELAVRRFELERSLERSSASYRQGVVLTFGVAVTSAVSVVFFVILGAH